MTAIVGYVNEKYTYLATDSLRIAGYNNIDHTDVKIFQLGPVLVGNCGSVRDVQVFQYHVEWPETTEANMEKKIIQYLIPRMRKSFASAGVLTKKDEIESLESMFLLATTEGLFTIYGNFCVTHHERKYAAIGSGAELAKGSLYDSHCTTEPQIKAALRKALEAASYHNVSIASPFHLMRLDRKSNVKTLAL